MAGVAVGGDQPHHEPEHDQESWIKLELICTAADEFKAHDIVVLDVRGQTIIADFFVLCSGTSTTHIQSIAQGVQDRLRERAGYRARAEGDAGSFWMILDYSDVILHVFDAETREFYDLERLWADARVVPWAPPVPSDAAVAPAAGMA